MSGPHPLTFEALGCWASLTGRKLRPLEVETLLAMDDAFVSASAKVAELARQEESNK